MASNKKKQPLVLYVTGRSTWVSSMKVNAMCPQFAAKVPKPDLSVAEVHGSSEVMMVMKPRRFLYASFQVDSSWY